MSDYREYPYLRKVIFLNNCLCIMAESWEELELVYLMNKYRFLFDL